VKVLVADDDVLLHEMLRPRLAAAGHEMISAYDGVEAWEILQRQHVRMLILDWMMPRLDGPELIRRIRASSRPGYTYVIFLTAKSGRDEIVDGLNLGADDYVTKPFRHEELLARVGVGERILDLEGRLNESLAREEALATQDGLTGLLNRRALYERARAELSRAAREGGEVGVILLDLDHFKDINDRFGHAVGDEALRRVADVLQKNQRDYDYTGRWGGEEFLVVLPGASLRHACAVAERIRAAVEDTELRGRGPDRVKLRASLGVASTSLADVALGVDDLLKLADDALYRAKAAGRNRVCSHEVPVAN
jgi:two-component system, cell cycle response regulator